MSTHTLAFVVLGLILLNTGIAIGAPKPEERPWTAARKVNAAVSLCQLTFLIWLLVTVIS